MTNRFFSPLSQFLNNSGQVLSGGTLTFVVTGTSTPASTYSDASLTTPNTNPVVLDSAGRMSSIFLDPAVTYGVTLKTSAGVTIWTADPVVDPAANVTAAFVAFAGNPNGFVAGNAGAVGGSGVSAVYDITNDALYFCTTTGDAGAAVWTAQTAGSASLSAANTFTNIQTIQITDASASLAAMLVFDWESATPAASDVAILFKAMGEDSAGNDQDYTRDAFRITDPTSASEDAERLFGVVTAGTLAYELVLSGAALYPETNDGLSIGKSGNAISDIYAASGFVFDINAGDVLLTHSANALAMTGGTLSVSYTAAGVLLSLVSTDAGATSGPSIELYRDSASPADGDTGPAILVYGKDSGGAKQLMGNIYLTFTDIDAGTEDGTWSFNATVAGVDTQIFTAGPNGLTVANGTLAAGVGTYSSTLGVTGVLSALSTLELGHASDSTISRLAAGALGIEGKALGAANCAFRATKSANQTLAASTRTQVTFNTEGLDQGAKFATNAVTPPAGWIFLNAQVSLVGGSWTDTSFHSVYIYKNGAELVGGAFVDITASVSIVDVCNGTDAYTVYTENTVGADIDALDSGAIPITFFCGHSA